MVNPIPINVCLMVFFTQFRVFRAEHLTEITDENEWTFSRLVKNVRRFVDARFDTEWESSIAPVSFHIGLSHIGLGIRIDIERTGKSTKGVPWLEYSAYSAFELDDG